MLFIRFYDMEHKTLREQKWNILFPKCRESETNQIEKWQKKNMNNVYCYLIVFTLRYQSIANKLFCCIERVVDSFKWKQ